KNTHELVYKSGIYRSADVPSNSIIIQTVMKTSGGSENDYTVFQINDSSVEAARITNGDDFSLVWSAPAPSGIITAVDFTAENSKYWLRFVSLLGKTEIIADDFDHIDIVIEVWNAEKTAIATDVDQTEIIPIVTPRGQANIRARFENGRCVIRVRTDIFGNWVFPADPKRVNGFRVYNILPIEAFVPFI
ncbi:MAG TPA: hypothetical protein PKH91_10545, partial [Flavobacterium sp.]|nr:hypothetical protein [Flavobacterium sp.]